MKKCLYILCETFCWCRKEMNHESGVHEEVSTCFLSFFFLEVSSVLISCLSFLKMVFSFPNCFPSLEERKLVQGKVDMNLNLMSSQAAVVSHSICLLHEMAKKTNFAHFSSMTDTQVPCMWCRRHRQEDG